MYVFNLGTDNSTRPSSSGEKAQWQNPQWASIVEAAVLTIIMFAAIIGNSMVVAVVYRRKELRNVTSIFIINLSISDIAVAILCMPFSIITALTKDWIFGEAFCKVNGFLNVFFLLSSILTLTAISVQKYFAIVMPLHGAVTTKRAIHAVVWTWCQAFITALTPVLGWNSYVHIPGRMQCSAKVPTTTSEVINCFFIIVTGFVVPLGVMHFSYFSIFVTVRKHTRRLRKHVVSEDSLKSEKTVTITLVIILSLFLLCWAPFSVLVTFASLNKKQILPDYFHILAYWMGFASSAINPIVFALRTKSFRNGYLEIIYSLCGCCCADGKEKREHYRPRNNTIYSDYRGSRRSVGVAWADAKASQMKNKKPAQKSIIQKENQRNIAQNNYPGSLSVLEEGETNRATKETRGEENGSFKKKEQMVVRESKESPADRNLTKDSSPLSTCHTKLTKACSFSAEVQGLKSNTMLTKTAEMEKPTSNGGPLMSTNCGLTNVELQELKKSKEEDELDLEGGGDPTVTEAVSQTENEDEKLTTMTSHATSHTTQEVQSV